MLIIYISYKVNSYSQIETMPVELLDYQETKYVFVSSPTLIELGAGSPMESMDQ